MSVLLEIISGDILKKNHVFITASKADSCSNSVLEALACGLPVIYKRGSSHREFVKKAGYGFEKAQEIPGLVEKVRDKYNMLRSRIKNPRIRIIAKDYLKLISCFGQSNIKHYEVDKKL